MLLLSPRSISVEHPETATHLEPCGFGCRPPAFQKSWRLKILPWRTGIPRHQNYVDWQQHRQRVSLKMNGYSLPHDHHGNPSDRSPSPQLHLVVERVNNQRDQEVDQRRAWKETNFITVNHENHLIIQTSSFSYCNSNRSDHTMVNVYGLLSYSSVSPTS